MKVSLKVYVDARIQALHEELRARLDANDKAVTLSQTTLTDRLQSHNGLIEQMRRQADEFATTSNLAALAQRLESLEQARSRVEGTVLGKQPLTSLGMVLTAAVIGAVVSFVATKIVS